MLTIQLLMATNLSITMSHKRVSSLGSFLLFIAGFAVAVIIAIININNNNNNNSVGDQHSPPTSRQLKSISPISQQKEQKDSGNHKIYAAFQFQRDPLATITDSTHSTLITMEHLPHQGEIMPFQLAQNAADWCMPVTLPPIDYNNCDPYKPVNRLPLFGGLTNALKYILLGVIKSFEDDRCFYIDESRSHLRLQLGEEKYSLLKRYFEPIGLNPDSIIVQKAILEGRTETKDWIQVWENIDNRRVSGSVNTIPSLDAHNMEGYHLKYATLLRMWKPLPLVRNSACLALEQQGLSDDYIAFSVRRGDKHSLEKCVYPPAEKYIAAAERAIETRFGGMVPKIFVATDDCAVMGELRTLQPTWNFVSQCDLVQNSADHGFVIAEMKDWSEYDTDKHYEKFMAELFGLAIAKYVVGVTYTNVAWWVLFMRRGNLNDIEFLDEHKASFLKMW